MIGREIRWARPRTPIVTLPQPFPDREATDSSFASHVNAGKVAAYRELGLELVMGEREGIRFRDAFNGTWYVNCHCNGGVFNLGHRNPAVIKAVRDGLDSLDVGNHHLVSGWRAQLAKRLAATTNGTLPGVVFGVGGGEAVDGEPDIFVCQHRVRLKFLRTNVNRKIIIKKT